MLQPEEIQKVTFEQSVFSGYKKEDVDAFLDKVHSEYSRLYKENSELVEKLKVCISKIEEYREDEKFLKSAIVNAQKLNETALQEIALKKQEIEETARKQADAIVSEAKEKAQQLSEETERNIAEIKAKSTREFAQQQLESANAYASKKREYEQKIQEKQEEYDALQQRIDLFKSSVLAVFEQQIDLLTTLPASEKKEEPKVATEEVTTEEVTTEDVAVDNDVTEQAVETETVAPEVQEAPEIIEEVEKTDAEEPVAETVDEVETIENEQPIEESETDETDPQIETVPDETEELSVDESPAENSDKEFQAEQIDIEDLIAVKPSPVEPEGPVLPEVDDTDDIGKAEQDSEEEFHLFGSSPLIFPTDIPEDDEDEIPQMKEKNSRFKKKLKFGVDFDVKKDK